MKAKISEQLGKIDAGIARSLDAGTGCDAKHFSVLEKLVEDSLPQDYKQLYLEFNGNFNSNLEEPNKISLANFAYGKCFFSIEETIADVDTTKKSSSPVHALAHASPEIEKTYTFSHKRIPFAHDYGSSIVCMDMSPTDAGLKGQIILVYYEYSTAYVIAPSLTALMQDFVEDLSAGKYTLDEVALTENAFHLIPDSTINPKVQGWSDPSNKWVKKYPTVCFDRW